MNKVVIFTDSTADLTHEDYKKHDIHVIPLLVNFSGKVVEDDDSLTPRMIYDEVAKTGELPHTSAVAPGVIVERFKKYVDQGFDVYYIGIGSTLSGTHAAALLAQKEFPAGRVYIGDSLNLSSASGLLVLKACKLRDEGQSAAQIYEEIEKLVPLVSAQFVVEKLDYLHKGGRCSGAKYWVGRLLKIHPLIKVFNGQLSVYKTPKGKMLKAWDALIDEFDCDFPDIDLDYVMITHALSTQESIEYLKSKLRKRIDKDVIHVTQAGSVISSHCGENTIGILYIKTKFGDKDIKRLGKKAKTEKKLNEKAEKSSKKKHKELVQIDKKARKESKKSQKKLRKEK